MSTELDAKIEKLSEDVRLLCELVAVSRKVLKKSESGAAWTLWEGVNEVGSRAVQNDHATVGYYEERLNKVLEARDRLCNERGDALMCNL